MSQLGSCLHAPKVFLTTPLVMQRNPFSNLWHILEHPPASSLHSTVVTCATPQEIRQALQGCASLVTPIYIPQLTSELGV